jgi:hypothetical protein
LKPQLRIARERHVAAPSGWQFDALKLHWQAEQTERVLFGSGRRLG